MKLPEGWEWKHNEYGYVDFRDYRRRNVKEWIVPASLTALILLIGLVFADGWWWLYYIGLAAFQYPMEHWFAKRRFTKIIVPHQKWLAAFTEESHELLRDMKRLVDVTTDPEIRTIRQRTYEQSLMLLEVDPKDL